MFENLFDSHFYGDFATWQEVLAGRRAAAKPRTTTWTIANVRDDYEIVSTDDAHEVYVDVPGVTIDNIVVQAQGRNVTVDVKDVGETRNRRSRAAHYRFEFPETADMNTADVTINNGVLTIRVAKSTSAQRRQLPVQTTTPALKS